MEGVAVCSVPHSGTHTAFNILRTLGYPRSAKGGDTYHSLVKHAHFWDTHIKNGKLDRCLAMPRVVIPIRHPALTFISRWKRLDEMVLAETVKDPVGDALEYTLANWRVLADHLDVIDHALVVWMHDGYLPAEHVAEYVEHGADLHYSEMGGVGNMHGDRPSVLEDVDVVPSELAELEDIWLTMKGRAVNGQTRTR